MKLYVKNNPEERKKKNIQNIYIQQFKAIRIGQHNNNKMYRRRKRKQYTLYRYISEADEFKKIGLQDGNM